MKRIFLSAILITPILAFVFYTPVDFIYPKHFPKPIYNFRKSPLTKEKITLGRSLFYDPLLSKDNTISCASCHSPFNAFAHTDHALSHGINDIIGKRNAPGIFNLAWQKSLMWDGAANQIEHQATIPISSSIEMGETMDGVVKKLRENNNYLSMFFRAFGDSNITHNRILEALTQFELTLVSANTKYDRVKSNMDVFTVQEQNGYFLFKKNCNSCHTEPLFSNSGFANNGLAVDHSLNDFGRWGLTHQSEDSLMFKIPSLRNLSYTSPYMHDGRFNRLYEVLNHYTDGVVKGPTLSSELQKGINLSSNQKIDLIAFLLTLNDKEFVSRTEFHYP